MTVLSIDFETRATVNLRKTGVYPYAEHPNTGIWCMAWAFDGEEPAVWWPEDVCSVLGLTYDWDTKLPRQVLAHIEAGGEIRAWNAEFERVIWREIMHKRFGFPNPKLEQWVCSAAEAAAMSLPRSLDQASKVTGVKQQKDDEGYSLMMRMTRPRKIHEDGRVEWWNVPERILRLGDYCKQDVRTEKAVVKVLRRLTPLEREHYLETCRMNDRGITVDVELVEAAIEVADEGVARANLALEQITAGEVTEVTHHQRLRQWVNDKGVETDSVAKKAVRELLESDLDPSVREALQLRADAGRTSIAKLDAMLECLCEDGKIHGSLMYHGASTGRWTARLVQPHNFPRGEVDGIEEFIPYVLGRQYESIEMFAHPVVVVSSMLRSMLTASPGHELLAADYSGIEARVVCWIAGQDDALELYRQGEDPYKHFAAKMYGVPLKSVTKGQRQTGKFAVLGCGFGMGAKTGQTQAKDVYGLTMSLEQTKEVIDMYRSTYDRVKAFWYAADDAAKLAVESPGEVVTFGPLRNLKFTRQGAYLYLILPARRPLVYAAPKIVEREVPWSTPEKPVFRPSVEISAVNPKTNQWSRQALYGGLITENIVQAIARDIMAEGKLRVERAGYPVLLSVHDEIVAERRVGEGDLKEYEALLTQNPEWAGGLPIAVEGWRGFRYRK